MIIHQEKDLCVKNKNTGNGRNRLVNEITKLLNKDKTV